MKISAALMDRLPQGVQILFMKSFAKTLVKRIGMNHRLILDLMKNNRA